MTNNTIYVAEEFLLWRVRPAPVLPDHSKHRVSRNQYCVQWWNVFKFVYCIHWNPWHSCNFRFRMVINRWYKMLSSVFIDFIIAFICTLLSFPRFNTPSRKLSIYQWPWINANLSYGLKKKKKCCFQTAVLYKKLSSHRVYCTLKIRTF